MDPLQQMIPAECTGPAKLFHRKIQTKMNFDWKQVYQDERRRPGYVIDNGKPPVKPQPNDKNRQPTLTSAIKAKQTR
jgi:hypothetical protein